MKAYCQTCAAYREVVDDRKEGHYEFGREVTYRVVAFDCDHEQQGTTVDIGPAPGAPYAPLGRLDRGDQPHIREDML